MTSGDGPINASPACSTFFANWAFSDKKPYLGDGTNTSIAGAYRDMKRKDKPRMDHVHAVLKSDPDDVVLGEVSGDGSETLADLVGLIGRQSFG